MTTKSDDPESPLGELAHLHAVLASIEGAMHDLHPDLVVPENRGCWGDVLRDWNATQLVKIVEPDMPVREWLAKWHAQEQGREALLKAHNDTAEARRLPEGLCRWVFEPACYRLLRNHGQSSATVWTTGTWHTWDLHGVGGENASAPTVDQAMDEALAAVIRQEFDTTPEQCEACDGTGYHDEDYEDPRIATLQAQLAAATVHADAYQTVARSRAALVDAISGKLGPAALDDALRRASELGGSPLDCSLVQLRTTVRQLRTKLTAMHRDLPRYPSLGSMGGGSVMESQLRAKWEKDVGSWANTFTRLQDAVESALDLAERTLTAETAREQQCAVCGRPVEEARRCYAIPHCYGCLPPPPPLQVVQVGEHDFRMSTQADRQVYEAARHEAVRTGAPPHPFGDGKPLDVAVAQSELGALLDKYADGHSGAARMNILAHFGASVLRASGNGAAIDDAAADAAHESMRRVEPLADPDERPKSPGESYIKVSTKGPFVECEWSPFSTCFTPKNWGTYGGEGNDGWYCALMIVNGFADMGIKATGEGDSQAAAELDAMCKVFRTLVEYVADTNDEERARLLAISIIARRMREAVPK